MTTESTAVLVNAKAGKKIEVGNQRQSFLRYKLPRLLTMRTPGGFLLATHKHHAPTQNNCMATSPRPGSHISSASGSQAVAYKAGPHSHSMLYARARASPLLAESLRTVGASRTVKSCRISDDIAPATYAGKVGPGRKVK